MWDKPERSTECKVPEGDSWVWNVPLFETEGFRVPDVNRANINAKNAKAKNKYTTIVNGCLYVLFGSVGLALSGYFLFGTAFSAATLFVVGVFFGAAIYRNLDF